MTVSLRLTAEADQLFGTAKDDTFTAEAGTLQANDQLLDQNTDDNDTLNAVINNANKGNIDPTLLNIENVNLDLDVFSGAQFNAANTAGATVTASSSKLGFNGEFNLTNTGDNNVVAGENVTNLDVDGLEAGNVNTGAATEASVDTVNANDVANVTVNGDIALTVGTATELALEATADSVVDLGNATSATEIVGSGEGVITLQGDLSSVTNISGVDTAVVTASGAIASDWNVKNISIAEDLGASGAITVADAANISIDEQQTGLTITGQGNTGSSATVSSSLAALGSLTFASFASAELDLTAANVDVAALDAASAALTVNLTDGAEIADLDGENIELVGAGDVTLADADDVETLDASNLDGELNITTDASATNGIEISGAVGNNTVAVTDDNAATFVGQAGDDAINLAANGSEVSLVTGAGDDTVTLEGNFTGTGAFDFGEGNDTLVLEDGVDTSGAATDLTLVGLENIVLEGGAGNSMSVDQLDGESFSIRGDGFATSELGVTLAAGGDSIDLSGLDASDSASNGAAIVVTGGDGDDTIAGTSSADTFVLGTETAAGVDQITNFQGGVDTIETADGNTIAATGFTDLGDLTADFSDLNAAKVDFATGGGNVTAEKEAYQFAFDGKDYLVIDNGTAGYDAGTDTFVEITGLTGTIEAGDILNAA